MESTHLVSQVDTEIGEFLASRIPILAAMGTELALFADYSRYLLSGGKRFRAQFCYWGVRATAERSAADDGQAAVALVRLCTALELFHAAALVHDDIIDNSDTRRGMPASHVRFETLHAESGWTGDAAAFGRASGILLGDLLLGWSDELVDSAIGALREGDLDRADAARAVRAEFNRMRTEVTLGQYLDILEENAWPSVPEADALSRAERVIVHKSARYSVEAPLVLGALLNGGSSEQVSALASFGLPLGIGFQLRDDVLGVFGDSAVTGKPSGDDLREGKRTVLVALTRARIEGEERRSFDALLGSPALDEGGIAALQRTIRDAGALERVEELIASRRAEALAALETAPLAPDAKPELAELAKVLTQRQS
jgi:geranylgeranyl diphosphate synthase type I